MKYWAHKKTICSISCLAMLVSIFACSCKSEGEKATDPGDVDAPGKLTVMPSGKERNENSTAENAPLDLDTVLKSQTKESSGPKERKRRLSAGYHFNEAESMRTRKDFSGAVEEYKKAICMSPDDGAFYKNLGGTFAMMGKLPEAEKTLRRGTEVAPKDWLIWNNLAVVLKEKGDLTGCAEALSKALEQDPPETAVKSIETTLAQLKTEKTESAE